MAWKLVLNEGFTTEILLSKVVLITDLRSLQLISYESVEYTSILRSIESEELLYSPKQNASVALHPFVSSL
jgi:hypothetical protein